MNLLDVQRAMLKVLSGRENTRFGGFNSFLEKAVEKELEGQPIPRSIFQQSVWSLVAQGLAYIDFSQPATGNWSLHLTDQGRAAVNDEQANPDDPSGYLAALESEVPAMTDTVKQYAREALLAYNARLYLASAVMLGVASESAMLELGDALVSALSGDAREKLAAILGNKKGNYIGKFEELRKRLDSFKPTPPADLSDGMDLWLNSVADLLRIYRNNAGHPTGKSIDRRTCFTALHLFARYAGKIYALKSFFGECCVSQEAALLGRLATPASESGVG